METVAEVISDAFRRMGKPPAEVLSPADMLSIVRSRLAFYNQKLQLSDQKVPLACKEVNYTGDDILLPDVVSPSWVERKLNIPLNNVENETWEYVPTINIDSLAEWKAEGRPAVSFYLDTGGNYRMRAVAALFDNNNTFFRVWHIPTLDTPGNKTDAIGLPPNFGYLLSAEIRMKSIPIMMAKTLQLGLELTPHQEKSWMAIQAEATQEFLEWSQLFEDYKNRSMGGRRGRTRRNILRNKGSFYR